MHCRNIEQISHNCLQCLLVWMSLKYIVFHRFSVFSATPTVFYLAAHFCHLKTFSVFSQVKYVQLSQVFVLLTRSWQFKLYKIPLTGKYKMCCMICIYAHIRSNAFQWRKKQDLTNERENRTAHQRQKQSQRERKNVC